MSRASTDESKGKGNEYDCVGPPGGFYFVAVDGMLVLLLLLLLQQQRQQQRQCQHGLNAGSHRAVVRTDEGKGKGKEDDFAGPPTIFSALFGGALVLPLLLLAAASATKAAAARA